MKKIALSIVILVLIFHVSFSQEENHQYVPETDTLVLKKLDQWQDIKFGLLMHWGTYSQWGIVESWSICAEDEDWCRRKNENYIEYKKQYEDLKKTFNPVKFDPEKWARAAKNAGMKYVVFTTKHHDGFCMFDTKTTDYKITSPECPFNNNPKSNVTKEIFNAFRNEGLWVGAYFSKPDWHSDYYWWQNYATPDRHVNYDIKKYPDRWKKFIDYTHTQIDELMTNYGKVDILWLDGGWVAPVIEADIQGNPRIPGYSVRKRQNQDINMAEMVRKARVKQAGLIVVDRAVPGKFQNYLTPENTVPEKMLPYPWESCIILGGGWSYSFDAKMMPLRKLVHLLVDIVAKGGNLLLNIGPGPDGTWYDEAYTRLNEMGKWIDINGEAIYNTRAIAPYKEGKVCLTRQKNGNAVYAIYLPSENELKPPSKIWLSSICPENGSKVTMLGVKDALTWEKVGNGFYVNIPESIQKNPPCDNAWVVKIASVEKK